MAQINKRTRADGKISSRMRRRMQGYPGCSKTSPQKKTSTMDWYATIEADHARSFEVVSKKANTKTVADMVDRYLEHYLPFIVGVKACRSWTLALPSVAFAHRWLTS